MLNRNVLLSALHGLRLASQAIRLQSGRALNFFFFFFCLLDITCALIFYCELHSPIFEN